MPSFSILKAWHTYAYFHPNEIRNGRITSLKTVHIFLKNIIFEAEDEDHLYANCLVLTANDFSQFLSRGISTHSPILTRVEFERISSWKVVILLLMFHFHGEVDVYFNCLFNILTNYNKWIVFSTIRSGHTHIHPRSKSDSKWMHQYLKIGHTWQKKVYL